MTLVDIYAWAASIGCVVTYFAAVRRPRRLVLFNYANVIGAVILVPYDITKHALPPALLSLTFGFVGLMGLRRRG